MGPDLNHMPLIQVEQGGAIAVVTLNQPEKRNALAADLRNQLIATLVRLDAVPECRTIIITGAEGNFCSGGDISGMISDDVLQVRHRMARVHELPRLIVNSSKLFIAAVEGAAFGAGFSLASCCDLVVAADNARFCASFTKLSLFPDLGLLWSLPGRVGSARAKALMLLGTVVDADTAAKIGLADHRTTGSAVDMARIVAAEYAATAPITTALIKSALARGVASFEDVLRMEADAQPLGLSTADHIAGREAFFSRQPPQFKGR